MNAASSTIIEISKHGLMKHLADPIFKRHDFVSHHSSVRAFCYVLSPQVRNILAVMLNTDPRARVFL